jgi:hypothetical protein
MPFKGVRIFKSDYIKPSRVEVVELNVNAEQIIEQAKKELGAKYDWGVWASRGLGIPIPKLLKRNRWTCAGLVATYLGLGNDKTTPGELYNKVKQLSLILVSPHQ